MSCLLKSLLFFYSIASNKGHCCIQMQDIYRGTPMTAVISFNPTKDQCHYRKLDSFIAVVVGKRLLGADYNSFCK